MKTYNTLIKFHKSQLDELKRVMGSLENQKQKFLQAIERLQADLKRELELASENVEMSHFFGDFAARIRARQEEIIREIMALDKKMEELRELIRAKFGELKTIEIAKENYLTKEKEKRTRRENEMLDEVALTQFMRKGDS